jgi:hypothetical protein
MDFLKSRIPIRTFYTSEERKKPGFWQIDTILPVLEFHSDNGSEFINNATEAWCKGNGIPFTRSRDHKKNGNCFVEQKNGAVVREYVGYDRLEGMQEQALLAAVYQSLPPLLNFFMPTQKLKSKTRVGSK